MTHRSHYHTFVRTVLAALTVVVGATLAVPVGAPAALVALEYTPRAAIVAATSPVSVASAFRAPPLHSEVTESSSLAPPASPTETVHLVRSTAPMPSHWALAEAMPGTSIEAASCEPALLSALAGTAQDPQDPETPDEECDVGTSELCIKCKTTESSVRATVDNGVVRVKYCVLDAECIMRSDNGVTVSFSTDENIFQCFDVYVEPTEDGEGT